MQLAIGASRHERSSFILTVDPALEESTKRISTPQQDCYFRPCRALQIKVRSGSFVLAAAPTDAASRNEQQQQQQVAPTDAASRNKQQKQQQQQQQQQQQCLFKRQGCGALPGSAWQGHCLCLRLLTRQARTLARLVRLVAEMCDDVSKKVDFQIVSGKLGFGWRLFPDSSLAVDGQWRGLVSTFVAHAQQAI